MDRPGDITDLLLSVSNGKDGDMKVTDFVRLYLDVWPFPNSAWDEENKYFMQVYVTLNRFLAESFDILLGMGTNYHWNRQDLLETLRLNLLEHTRLLYNSRLSYLAGQHTGAALSIMRSRFSLVRNVRSRRVVYGSTKGYRKRIK